MVRGRYDEGMEEICQNLVIHYDSFSKSLWNMSKYSVRMRIYNKC
jgi:hypothetical protein